MMFAAVAELVRAGTELRAESRVLGGCRAEPDQQEDSDDDADDHQHRADDDRSDRPAVLVAGLPALHERDDAEDQRDELHEERQDERDDAHGAARDRRRGRRAVRGRRSRGVRRPGYGCCW